MESRIRQRCSSCLSLELFGVETRSFLPQGQSDAGDLACQCQSSHAGSHSTLHPGHIEVTQGARTSTGRDSRTLEEVLQFLIVVLVETTHTDAFTIALQLPTNATILTAVMRLDGETAVRPELTFGAKTVRGLQQCHQ